MGFADVNDLGRKNELVNRFFSGEVSCLIIMASGDNEEVGKLYEDSECFRIIKDQQNDNFEIKEACYVDPITRNNNATLLISRKSFR